MNLDTAIEKLGNGVSVQGNLNPFTLFQSRDEIEKKVKMTLDQGKSARGHIFNLGHGIMPGTSVDNVKILVDTVHTHSQT